MVLGRLLREDAVLLVGDFVNFPPGLLTGEHARELVRRMPLRPVSDSPGGVNKERRISYLVEF